MHENKISFYEHVYADMEVGNPITRN